MAAAVFIGRAGYFDTFTSERKKRLTTVLEAVVKVMRVAAVAPVTTTV